MTTFVSNDWGVVTTIDRNSIIGGVFGLEDVRVFGVATESFLKPPHRLLSNARSGIWSVIQVVRPAQVWMPSYLCSVMVDAVDQDRCQLRFYEVDYDLNIREDRWVRDVLPGDLVVFIDYFGFSTDRRCMALVKERKAWVLEDACQAMLSKHVGTGTDFVLYSPRKFIGVPDGGILQIRCDGFDEAFVAKKPPALWWLNAFAAVLYRRDFDRGSSCRDWFQRFREAETGTPVGHYAVNELSQAMLTHSIDYSAHAKQRRENYAFLLNRLGDYAIFPHLPEDVVPLVFPIRITSRELVRNRLFQHNVYPPVHWPIAGIVPTEFRDSHRLAEEIMTLPCDQRYALEDMTRMASLVVESL